MMVTKGAITMAAMGRVVQTAIMAAGTMAIAVVAADAQVARGPVAADAAGVIDHMVIYQAPY